MTRSSETRASHIPPSAVGNIARLAYAFALQKGVDVDRLLAKAGLSRSLMDNQSARIRAKAQIKFLDIVADAVDDDLLGFHLALGFDLRIAGLLYYVFASSKTLDDALRNGARCSSIVNESIRLTVREGKRRIVLILEPVGIARRFDRHQIEFWVAAIIRACRLITRRHVTAEAIALAHQRKPTPELNRFFGSKIIFGAHIDELAFSPSIRTIPVVSTDPYLNELLITYCEQALAEQRNRGLFATSVENTIALLLPHGRARMDEVAKTLGLTQRTLARRLSSEGLTFAGILRNLRISLANRHLADQELSISQIAWLLGYQETSAFTHAYKHWTGHAPRTIRRREQ